MKLWVLVVLVACSGGRAPAPSANERPTTCPANYGVTGECGEPGRRCAYAEGTCLCGVDTPCHGDEPETTEPPPATWRCTPKLRPDGCPGEPPSGPCEGTRECSYGSCGGTVYGCVDGQWKAVREIAPPA